MEKEQNRITKTTLYNKRTSRGIPDFMMYDRGIVIKTTWAGIKQVDQCNLEDPETNPHTYGHLIFDKEAKTI